MERSAELIGDVLVVERLAPAADADLHEVLGFDDAELEGARPLRTGPVLGLVAEVEVGVEGDQAELAVELAGHDLQHGDGDGVVAAEDDRHGAGGQDVGELLVGAQECLLDVARHHGDVAVVDDLEPVLDDQVAVDLGHVAAGVTQRVEDRVAPDRGGAFVGAAAIVDGALGRRRGQRRQVRHGVEDPDPFVGDAEHGDAGALEPGGVLGQRGLHERGDVVAQHARHLALGPAPVRGGLEGRRVERLAHLLRVQRCSLLGYQRRVTRCAATAS